MGCSTGVCVPENDAAVVEVDNGVEDLPIEYYSCRIGGYFHPEYVASIFVNYCYDRGQVNVKELRETIQFPTNNPHCSLHQISLVRSQRPAKLNLDQALKEHQQYLTEKYELVQEEQKKNKETEEVQSEEKDVRLSASHIPEMIITKLEPKHLKISFTELVSLIQIELDYVQPQEVFNVISYICFSSKQYSTQQLKQFDKSAKQFDIQVFLKIFYIFSPEQYQKIMKHQILILFFFIDEMFNTQVDVHNLKSILQFHFKNIEIDQFIQLFDETLIDVEEFEVNFAKKAKMFDEDITVYLGGVNVKEFYSSFNKKQKYFTKQIESCISTFMAKTGVNSKPIRGNISQAALLDDEQMNEEREMKKIKKALGD